MNGITIILWATIAIIAISAIILVKLHYKKDELSKDDGTKLNESQSTNKILDAGKNILSRNKDNSKSTHTQLNNSNSNNSESNISFNEVYDEPVAYEVENDNAYNNIKLESANQVIIDYGTTVEKFQEPINKSQMDIMSQNNKLNNEKHELKDLFTIDELIKESKRKDSQREKETHPKDDKEIDELKESIKQRQENKKEDKLIDEIASIEEETVVKALNETETAKPEETINDIIAQTTEPEKETISDAIDEAEPEKETADNATTETDKTEETINDLISSKTDAESEDEESKTPIITSQDIEEAINTASQEVNEEVESISESSDITDVLLDNTPEEAPTEEIKEPMLKTPTKVDEAKNDYEFGADINDGKVFGEYENDLDYRKDLAKITNTIKGSKIFKDVKERLSVSEPEIEYAPPQEDFIRNVNDYEDDFAPIINETHSDFEATYEEYHKNDFNDTIRPENTAKAFEIIRDVPDTPNVPNVSNTPKKPAESKIGSIKEKPSRDNIKIQINNNEVVLKKGDEIIFNHLGETYSSQVYGINGDDISVKYRRQNITIKPSDVKKVY